MGRERNQALLRHRLVFAEAVPVYLVVFHLYTKSELRASLWKPIRTPDVATCNGVAMARSRGAAEARPRASARTRRPSLKARAQPVECEHASKPQAAGGARRGGRAAAPEGLRLLTPAPRERRASDGGGGDGGDDTPKTGASRRASSCGQKSGAATQRRPKSAVSKRAATTPVGKPRQLQLEGSPKSHDALDARTPARAGNHKGKRRKKKDARMPRGVAPVVAEAGPTAVKRSTARRSTAGSTAIREHAVTAVGIRTNETLQHTFRTGRRAAATRATHVLAVDAPPTFCPAARSCCP